MILHNSNQEYALAFDTSAYTTSVALVGSDGHVAYDGRIVLDVPVGQRGLRQSDALFQHVENLPILMEKMEPVLRSHPPTVIAASTSPRNLPDSYMPVFRGGHMLARSLAAALHVPLLAVSHQEGHLWAAFLALGAIPPIGEQFLAVHVSGGTTEALLGSMQCNGRIELRIIGDTGDLTAGKFIDRVGVALGFSFPAGAAIEQAARRAANTESLPVRPAVKGTKISFSGPLTAVERLIGTAPPEVIALTAQNTMAQGLAQWAENVVKDAFASPPQRAYWVGGVAANQALRSEVVRKLGGTGVGGVYFATPNYSTDNALGVAYYAATHTTKG